MDKQPDRNPRKALGKGLSALLPSRSGPASPMAQRGPQPVAAPAAPEENAHLPGDFQSIPLEQIEPGEQQPRENFDEEKLEQLAQSIRVNGLIQPITIRKVGQDRYQIIAGERRWKAAYKWG